MTYDSVNPSHYSEGRQFEPIEVIEDWGLNYRLGCALKYIARNNRKPGEDPREGLQKAIWYLQREIDSLASEPLPGDSETPYEEVLQYYGQTVDEKEAWGDHLGSLQVNTEEDFVDLWETQDKDWEDFWNNEDTDLLVTETSVFIEPKAGPVGAGGSDFIDWASEDLDQESLKEDIRNILNSKALDQFTDNEIVATIEKEGWIFGVKKDGSTHTLKSDN